ncbi:YeiH family protein [Dermabacteraceae bacterium P7074]
MPTPDSASPDARSFAAGRFLPLLPGIGLSLLVALAALALNAVVPPLSAALVAILVGAVLTNLHLLPAPLAPGLTFSSKQLLRFAIVLLGLQLPIGELASLGPGVIALVVAVVAVGMVTGMWLGRLLGISPNQSALIAGGFSICGAAAVAGVRGILVPDVRPGESAQEAEERLEAETATAVALVVVFGTLMIPLLPALASLLALTPHVAGIWMGASIHEVAQVVAAALLTGNLHTVQVAAVVKLGRVLLLAPVIIALGLALNNLNKQRTAAAQTDPVQGTGNRAKRPPLVPLFVLGFIAAVALRSLLPIPPGVLLTVEYVQKLCLIAAMFALGTGVKLSLLRQVGGRPIILAAILTALVTALGLAGAVLV